MTRKSMKMGQLGCPPTNRICVLPRELLDEIMNYLSDDMAALKSCSLSCHALRAPTHPVLFHTVSLDLSPDLRDRFLERHPLQLYESDIHRILGLLHEFVTLLEVSPDIARRARCLKLRLRDFRRVGHDEIQRCVTYALQTILRRFASVRRLCIDSSLAAFGYLAPEIKLCVHDILALPTLRHVEILHDRIGHPDVEELFWHVEDLRAVTLLPRRVEWGHLRNATVDLSDLIVLEALHMPIMSCETIEYLLHVNCPFDIRKLNSMTVPMYPLTTFRHPNFNLFLEVIGRTLTTLTLSAKEKSDIDGSWRYAFVPPSESEANAPPIDFELLPTLRILNIVDMRMSGVPLDKTAQFLDALGSSASSAVEDIYFSFAPMGEGDLMFGSENPAWKKLDAALTGSHVERLRCVTCEMPHAYSPDIILRSHKNDTQKTVRLETTPKWRKDATTSMRKRLPTVALKGVLEVC